MRELSAGRMEFYTATVDELVKAHGRQAPAAAAEKAERYRAQGDDENYRTWRRIALVARVTVALG